MFADRLTVILSTGGLLSWKATYCFHVCVWADSRNLAVGILVALLTVLGAGLIVCIKRKSLLGLLFTSKKNPIEKLRCLFFPSQNIHKNKYHRRHISFSVLSDSRSVSTSISRPSAPNQPPTASTTSPSRPAPPLPHGATIFKVTTSTQTIEIWCRWRGLFFFFFSFSPHEQMMHSL